MVKTVRLDPFGTNTAIATNTNLLSVLMKNDVEVTQECGGRGICATCHVYIRQGEDSLSPLTKREQRTLGSITSCNVNSRLACQARVIGEGVIVELPAGMYISQDDDIEDLIGRRAQSNLLHPLSGQVLVEEGKLITRSVIAQLQTTQSQVKDFLSKSESI
ncbi:(2Fe-2S)-binding protein [Pleurocapsa sp. CCALA 161]|uniref:2Fe-2S iron-sulfur cluster-binding protein n=1 Tax=Pleurocapsa sp. CCALA 161 TaxID=2107688 RepID=UPI000D058764|nr:2Fe-2S iron-sulfur cluster-binding protein [Pleurocapsa sp. CCALA 161]PSB12076.1 (2Fe-2S)-binding protein [Pleurocapsa sp. CCALA 161]